MQKAGFCAECSANSWLNEDGSCVNGHPATSVTGVYEVASSPAVTAGPQPPAGPPEGEAPKRGKGMTVALVVAAVLLLGCVVVGILVAIAIPVFDSASANAKQRACFSNQRVIEGALQQFLANTPDATEPDLAGPVDAGSPLVSKGYIPEQPSCQLAPGTPYELDEEGSTTCPAGDPPAGHGHY